MNAQEMRTPARTNDSRRMPDREIERKGDRPEATSHARDDGAEAAPRNQSQREIAFDIAAWFGLEEQGERTVCMTECWYG
jgi:hypothetical protein